MAAISTFNHARRTEPSSPYASRVTSESPRQLRQILNGHKDKHPNNQHHADDLRRHLHLNADGTALDLLDEQKNDMPPIHNRQRQKVNHRQVRRDESKEVE